jgi:hypothetical protein
MGRNRDFDDDDFNFDDDFSFDDDNGDQLRGGVGGDEDDLGDFTFDDDLGTTDDFEDIELGDEGGDFTFDEDEELVAEEDAGGRSNRTFILLAGVMIVLFLAGLVAVIILATRESPADVSVRKPRPLSSPLTLHNSDSLRKRKRRWRYLPPTRRRPSMPTRPT